MNITTIALLLNAAIGVAVWQSSVSLIAKIILTVLIVMKFILFFIIAWMSASDGFRKAGAVMLIVLNVGIIIYTLFKGAFFVVIPTSVTLVVAGLWMCSSIFCVGVKKIKKP